MGFISFPSNFRRLSAILTLQPRKSGKSMKLARAITAIVWDCPFLLTVAISSIMWPNRPARTSCSSTISISQQFKEFLDRGGYRNQQYWKHEFRKDGRTLSHGPSDDPV